MDVDIEFEEAIVRYSPALVNTESMIKATTDIGFPSSLKPVPVAGELQNH